MGESVGLDHKMMPFLVRHSAWQITHYQVRRLDDRWNSSKRLVPISVLERAWHRMTHYVGTSAGVRRCRSIWRRPENQRWNRKMLTEMNGDLWNLAPWPKDKPPQVRGVYITLERLARKVVRNASGKQKCNHQNAEHDSRRLWTMKLHRQQL